MFTGIVEEQGRVVSIDWHTDDAALMRIEGPLVTSDASEGDSIAVNGVCLTVVDVKDGAFSADVMRETLNRTSLAQAVPGARVNLERAVTPTSRLGGHIMQGHVDGIGTVLLRTPSEHWEIVRIAVPMGLAKYVVEKGSIAIDGVSLTVAAVQHGQEPWLEVSLIPTTLENTSMGTVVEGAIVNLEVDVLAKYVEGLLAGRVDDSR
jgi:riboflavin synthase